MKKFNFKFNNTDYAFNRGNIFENNNVVEVSFWLNSFQEAKNGRSGFGEISRMRFQLFFQNDPEMSALIDDCHIELETYDGQKQLFKLDEVDPEELYWIGKAFIEIAKFFGIDKEEVIKTNEE